MKTTARTTDAEYRDGGVISVFFRNKMGERRVSPPLYRLLLTAHIIVSVGWLGIVFASMPSL